MLSQHAKRLPYAQAEIFTYTYGTHSALFTLKGNWVVDTDRQCQQTQALKTGIVMGDGS